MVFRLRVTLTGIKGFFRIYHVNGATTLYTLHKQMRADMEFPQDQLIMFKGLDIEGGVVGRYGLFDLGSGTVDQVSLEKAVKAGATDFVYFYDVTNRKSVNITVEGEVEGAVVNPDSPFIAESKGPNPIEFENGYVAYEDLPDEQRLAESKGPNPIEFENGYVAYEDLPDEQRHLPGENKGGVDYDDDEDFEDEEEDEEEDDDDEDGKEIYDENE